MKIAEVCPRYYPDIGGIETVVKEISERLVTAGHEVEVITTSQTKTRLKHEHINGVLVTRVGAFAPNDAYFLSPEMYFYLKSQKYDIIHAHAHSSLTTLAAALATKDAKFVFTTHYHLAGHTAFRKLLHIPYSIAGNYIFSKASQILCDSEYEKNLVESTFNHKNKTLLLPVGIDKKEFERFKNDIKDRSRKNKILLYVGRLEEYKGVQYILQSLPELPEAILRVVGKGNYSSTLSELTKSLKIDDRVEWYSNLTRHELLMMYADADVSLMLSSLEAYGITTAEALLTGTPCIVRRGSALEEFIDDKVCIGVSENINIDEIVTAVKKLYNCEERYQGKILDWDEVTDQLITVFNNMRKYENRSTR